MGNIEIKPDAGSLQMRTELLDLEVEASSLTKRIQRRGKGNLSELIDVLRKRTSTAPPEEAEALTIAVGVLEERFEFDPDYGREKAKALEIREIQRRVDDLCKQGWERPDAIKIVLANSKYRSLKTIYNKIGKR
jgi:hypothetical protein